MELIDNINRLLGDDLKQALKPGGRLKVAASCFSIYAFEALKAELEQVDELHFIFTSPTFVAEEVTDKKVGDVKMKCSSSTCSSSAFRASKA